MDPIDMNKSLWIEAKAFDLFSDAVLLVRQAVSEEKIDVAEVLKATNMMDDIVQRYESRYCPMDDPIFFWWFATANAIFLQETKKFDELGGARIGYIVNGYKEALTKHLLYPSFSAEMLEIAHENMGQFANDYDKEWMAKNYAKFKPVSD